MLNNINFSDEDTLYILGDVVDRGNGGMKILAHIAEHDNIVLLKGNHDVIALSLLSHLDKLYDENCSVEVINVFKMWLSDGGEPTLKEYLLLDVDNRKTILKTLANALISKEVCVNGKKFILAHTVSGVDNICDFDEWKLEDFIEGEPDYDEIYFDDMFVVTGHVETVTLLQKI